jgi:hypothetical protein
MSGLSRTLWSFVIAVVLVALIGAVLQTQYNLAMLEALGAPVPLEVRLQTTGLDLLGFAPVFAILVTFGFALALPLATLVSKFLPALHWFVFALAGALAIFTALCAVNAALPMPTFIGANRSLDGTLGLMLCGALGGLLYDKLRCAPVHASQGITHEKSA